MSPALLREHHKGGQAPASTDDFHRRTPSRLTLDRVFQLEDTRVLSNDWVIRYDTRYFQVARQSQQAPARSTVLVREAVTGAIEIRYRGRLMRWSETPVPPPRPPAVPRAAPPAKPAAAVSVRPRPSVDHPWRRGYVERQRRGLPLERGQ